MRQCSLVINPALSFTNVILKWWEKIQLQLCLVCTGPILPRHRFGSVRVGFCQVPPLQLPNFFQAAEKKDGRAMNDQPLVAFPRTP